MTMKRMVVSLAAAMLAASAGAAAPDGAQVFAQNCAACHQAAGQGVPGAFPALARDKFVNGDPKGVAMTLIKGRNAMPSFRDVLNDAQLSAVTSYVRRSWGNKAPPIPPAAFAAARKAR